MVTPAGQNARGRTRPFVVLTSSIFDVYSTLTSEDVDYIMGSLYTHCNGRGKANGSGRAADISEGGGIYDNTGMGRGYGGGFGDGHEDTAE